MPFVTQKRRKALENHEAPESYGDVCYTAYKCMVEEWKLEPRWTTAHRIYRDRMKIKLYGNTIGQPELFTWLDAETAIDLAWQVFFQIYIMPYEIEKRSQNGDI